MSLSRCRRRAVIGGVALMALGSGLWITAAALADGPPTPNPLAPTLNPMISQLPPQIRADLQLGALPSPGVDITVAGQAAMIHGDPTAGADKFAANCAVCHGDRGTAGITNPGSSDGTVPTLQPIDPGFLADANGDPLQFARDIDLFIQHGSRPAGPAPLIEMPAWGDHKLITLGDTADIEAYVMELNGVFWPDRCPGLRLDVANPSPGSRVEPGSYIISGSATDVRAAAGGPAISRIDFFLDSRDAGGTFVGTATPGGTAGSASTSFQTKLSLPKKIGPHQLVAYAVSAVTSQQSVVSIPIALGEDSSKAFSTPPTADNSTCFP